MWAIVCVLPILLLSFCSTAHCQTGAEARALRQQLFVTQQYDKKVRAATDQTDATEAYVSFHITNLNEVDEVKEVIRTTGYLRIEWHDNYLSWDPSNYSNIYYSHWPQDDVWKPDVTLKNSYEDYKQLGNSALNVQVSFSGLILWTPFRVFQSTCAIDITYFPYDIQTCQLVFVAWSYTKAEVYMQAGNAGIDLSEFETNSEWDIIDSSSALQDETTEASVIFTLVMRRKPRYILLTVFFPILLLTFLNLFVFVLPCDSGERAGYAVTVFLAFAVFLTVINSTLPENSDSTSVLSIYILVQTVQSTAITMIGLFSLRLNSLKSPLPKLLGSVMSVAQLRRCKKQSVGPDEVIKLEEKGKTDNSEPQKGSLDGPPEEDQGTWQSFVNFMDVVYLLLFALCLIVSTAVCLSMLQNAANSYQKPSKPLEEI